MNIKEYAEQLKKLSEKMKPQQAGGKSFYEVSMEQTEIWNNEACKGYAIKAARAAGLSEDQTRTLLLKLETAFDEITVDEAEAIAENCSL